MFRLSVCLLCAVLLSQSCVYITEGNSLCLTDFRNAAATEAYKPGLTRGTCLVASHLQLAALAVLLLLWVWYVSNACGEISDGGEGGGGIVFLVSTARGLRHVHVSLA